MGKAWDWEKIFESLVQSMNFSVRLFYEDVNDLHGFGKREIYVEYEAFAKEAFYESSGRETGEYEDGRITGYGAGEDWTHWLEEDVLTTWVNEKILAINDFFEKSCEEFIRVQESRSTFLENENSIACNKTAETALTERSMVFERDVKKLTEDKKNAVMNFSRENEGEKNINMRFEIVREEKSDFDYDEDAIVEIVGQKLYEMMQKGAEGFYL